MPKATLRNDAWREGGVPKTALQRSAFIDRCVAWLVHEPSNRSSANHLLFALEDRTQCAASPLRDRPSTEIGLSHVDVRRYALEACAFCGGRGDDACVMVGNPFAQRSNVIVCASCVRPSLLRGEAEI